MDSYLIVTSTLWHRQCFWCKSFQLGSNSQITAFCGLAPLILQSQDTSHLPAEKSCINPAPPPWETYFFVLKNKISFLQCFHLFFSQINLLKIR